MVIHVCMLMKGLMELKGHVGAKDITYSAGSGPRRS